MFHQPRRSHRSADGFALLGLMIVLGVLALGLGAIVVFADRLFQAEQAMSVVNEVDEIRRAILGDQRDTFGYFGEVGTFPASLGDLVSNAGNAGWRGPYLRDPRIVNGMLLDPWGQPYELWVIDGTSGPDQMAIISRGPDGLSTNTAANPNVSANFMGVTPITANYFTSDPRNADNVVFPNPDPAHPNALDVSTTSIFDVTINNYDENDLVNAFVPACPGLFNITVTNTSRGTNDVPPTAYSPGFRVTLSQGTYRVFVTTPLLQAAAINDRIVVFPVVPVFVTYNITGLDSSGTDPYTLTVTNKYPTNSVTVYSFSSSLGTVASNATVTFTPKACSVINVKNGSTTLETFTMPFGNTTKIVGASAAAITITNNMTVTVQAYEGTRYLGDIRRNRSSTFSTGLVAGDVVTVKRQDTGATVKTITLVAGSQTAAVP